MVSKSQIMSMKVKGFVYVPYRGGMFINKYHFKQENIQDLYREHGFGLYDNGTYKILFKPFEMQPTSVGYGVIKFTIGYPKDIQDLLKQWVQRSVLKSDRFTINNSTKSISNKGTMTVTMLPIVYDQDFNIIETCKLKLKAKCDFVIFDLCEENVEYQPYYNKMLLGLDTPYDFKCGASFNACDSLNSFFAFSAVNNIDFTDMTGENITDMSNICSNTYSLKSLKWDNLKPDKVESINKGFFKSSLEFVDLSAFPNTCTVTKAFELSNLPFRIIPVMCQLQQFYDQMFEAQVIYQSDGLCIVTEIAPKGRINQFKYAGFSVYHADGIGYFIIHGELSDTDRQLIEKANLKISEVA